MSLILEALNKADRAREGGVNPAESPSSYPLSQHRPMVPLWAILLGLGFLAVITIAVVVLVWQLLSSSSAPLKPLVAPQNSSVATQRSLGSPQNSMGSPQSSMLTPVTATALSPDTSTANYPAINVSEDSFKPLRRPSFQVDKPSVAPEIAEIYGMAKNSIEGMYATQTAEGQDLPAPRVTYEMITRDVTTHSPLVDNQNLPNEFANESAIEPPVVNKTRTEKNNSVLPSAEEVQRMWQETKTQVAVPDLPVLPYAQTPYLYQLPQNFQRRIPSLLYQNHIYSAKGSAVILNGKTYRKNDIIAPDLVVRDITEDELILDYLKRPFKLAALSSWVQMN